MVCRINNFQIPDSCQGGAGNGRPVTRFQTGLKKAAAGPILGRTGTLEQGGAMGVYDFSAKSLDGREVPLADWRGKVVLVVNVASKCGFTPQYAGLEALYRKFKDRGFEVVGFPCNQFGAQEPGDAAEIANFCQLTYDVSFPMMAKIDVNGPQAHPLYTYLKKAQKGVLGSEAVKWNFTKFLLDREGRAVRRFAPTDTPEHIGSAIEALL